MSRKLKFKWVAAVIPAYDNRHDAYDYQFNVNQYISPQITVLDIALFTCNILKCDSIIVIARAEQIPYLKLRYGDAIHDCVGVNLNTQNSVNKRPVPIYYITPSEKYSAFDTHAVNIHNVGDLLSMAFTDLIGKEAPTTYFICNPCHLIAPQALFQYRNSIRQANKDAFRINFLPLEFKIIKNGQLFSIPERSHLMIGATEFKKRCVQIKSLFKEIVIDARRADKKKLLSYTIESLYPERTEYHPFILEEHQVFDLRKWSEYVRLMNSLMDVSEETKNFFKYSNLMLKSNIKFMRSMRSMNEADYWSDLSFSNVQLTKKESKTFQRWKRTKIKFKKENDK